MYKGRKENKAAQTIRGSSHVVKLYFVRACFHFCPQCSSNISIICEPTSRQHNQGHSWCCANSCHRASYTQTFTVQAHTCSRAKPRVPCSGECMQVVALERGGMHDSRQSASACTATTSSSLYIASSVDERLHTRPQRCCQVRRFLGCRPRIPIPQNAHIFIFPWHTAWIFAHRFIHSTC